MLARRAAPLLLLVTALAGGCSRRPAVARNPHEVVACVGCHRALPADTGRGSVPDVACTSSGCHPGGGKDSARIATVTFSHQRHPDGRGGSAGCATCHTHVAGSVAMVADTSACALCHVKDLAETRNRQPNCRSCHAHPKHSPETSQGVPISHALLDEEKDRPD